MDNELKAILTTVLEEEFFNDGSSLPLLTEAFALRNRSSTASYILSEFPLRSKKRFKNDASEVEIFDAYEEEEFHKRFRMKKETFLKLHDAMKPYYEQKLPRGDSPIITLMLSLMITLYYLSREISMQDIGQHFNVSSSIVCNETKKIIRILVIIATDYIKWPSVDETLIVAEQFSERSRIPGVVGAIDGCHIEVVPPRDQQRSYIDRKFNHSIILQGICTAKKIFTNVSIGTPGRRHDITAMKNSTFWKKLEKDGVHSLFYDDEHHLVGDSAYMCRSWCLVPFEFSATMTLQQRRYNYALSRTRIVIEHTFGLLKGRWRRLLHVRTRDIAKASDIVLACCVLHNFCYINGDKVIEDMVDPNMTRTRGCKEGYNNESEEEKRKGKIKRDTILGLFERN